MSTISTCKPSDELIALYEIGKAINSTLQLSEVLELIMNMTIKYLGAEAGSIMLLNEKEELVVSVAKGLDISKLKNLAVKLGEGISGHVALTGEPLLLLGRVDNRKFKGAIDREEDINSSLCVPLRVKNQIRGVLNLRKASSEREFNQDQLNFLSMISDQAALAIENARLYELEQKRIEELKVLNNQITLEKLKLETILKNLADGVMVLNEFSEVVLINRRLEEILNCKSSSLEGKKIDTLFFNKDLIDFIKSNSDVPQEFNNISQSCGFENDKKVFDVGSNMVKGLSDKSLGQIVVFHDITHIKKIQRLKSDVVSMVSHELRTPITSIIGFADILLMKEVDGVRRKKYLSIIKDESSKLLELINNLLDLSKLETGRYEFRKDKVNLQFLLKKAIEVFSEQFTKHSIVLKILEDLPGISGDEDMIYRVIINLLSNAIKYSPSGGNIYIELKDGNKYIEVSIKDEGIGIPKEDIPYLFEKFYRGNPKIISGIKGTGLGLANVKHIIEAHGGSISVESELHKGSKFTFYLLKEGNNNEN